MGLTRFENLNQTFQIIYGVSYAPEDQSKDLTRIVRKDNWKDITKDL
jgi:hypothetical protein